VSTTTGVLLNVLTASAYRLVVSLPLSCSRPGLDLYIELSE